MNSDRPDDLPRQPDRIETNRLVLRRFERDDAPAIVAHLADREMSWNLGRVPHPYTPRRGERLPRSR